MKLMPLTRSNERRFLESALTRLRLLSTNSRGRVRSCRCSRRTSWRRNSSKPNLAKGNEASRVTVTMKVEKLKIATAVIRVVTEADPEASHLKVRTSSKANCEPNGNRSLKTNATNFMSTKLKAAKSIPAAALTTTLAGRTTPKEKKRAIRRWFWTNRWNLKIFRRFVFADATWLGGLTILIIKRASEEVL